MTVEPAYEHTDLSDLVRPRMDELGLSYRTLAEQCDAYCQQSEVTPAPGQRWTRGTLENLAKGRRIIPPDTLKLQALAAALQLPLRTLQEAAGRQFFGVDTKWSADGKVRALIADFDELDEEDQARVLALIESRRRVKG